MYFHLQLYTLHFMFNDVSSKYSSFVEFFNSLNSITNNYLVMTKNKLQLFRYILVKELESNLINYMKFLMIPITIYCQQINI